MSDFLFSLIGLLIPFFGTTLGSSFVFFLKNISNNLSKSMIGFAVGVMLSASIFSLLIPSIDLSTTRVVWIPSVVGFILGFVFLIIINLITEKISNKKIDMLMFSVTLHNIPEGMAVGVAFASFLVQNSNINIMIPLMLSIGIAVQNIPEGSIISMPLNLKGKSKFMSFLYGSLSGIVEPIFAFLTILLLDLVVPILPYLLSFASGCMIYVIFWELIPQMHEEKKSILGIIGIMIGFILMMALDISFS